MNATSPNPKAVEAAHRAVAWAADDGEQCVLCERRVQAAEPHIRSRWLCDVCRKPPSRCDHGGNLSQSGCRDCEGPFAFRTTPSGRQLQ